MTETTHHNDNVLAGPVPPRQPDQPMPTPLDRSRAVRVIAEFFPITEAAKIGLAHDVLIWLSDGEIAVCVKGMIHSGEPLWTGMTAWQEQGFAPRMFGLMPASPIEGVTV